MYADDTVIIAESKNQLQQLIDTVVEESEAKGLILNNSAKSFTMVFSKSEMRPTCKITVPRASRHIRLYGKPVNVRWKM